MSPEMLYALRDQAGVPAHPLIFLALGVLTFALHMVAVQVMLGAASLTLWGAFQRDQQWRRLASAMLTTAKIAVSVAIVLGVAPLLFVQVIYDPFWYTSNVLSAWWVIGFIITLIAAYIAMYVFYWQNPNIEAEGGQSGIWMVISLILFLTVGFIVHTLSQQMFYPEKWMNWYAPNGHIDPTGLKLHQWHASRYLFFIALSSPIAGAWLIAYRRYLLGAGEIDKGYLNFLKNLSFKLIFAGGLISTALGSAWMLSLPEKMTWFMGSVWMWIALAALMIIVALPWVMQNKLDKGFGGYAVFAGATVSLIVIGTSREMLRFVTLNMAHQYNALDYRINMDWYSTVLFFGTFAIIGGTTLAYLLTVAWQAGQTKEGIYKPSQTITRLGQWSVGLLVAWTVSYFAVGFWVWAR